eukprot:CAMPEP_0206472978 /NCGR_PEP_ID=MMETSP0324_2-20121206/32563_1 /ASSEMBLY_ACC=CAM_ASM_000836 /TAXON_ID=2866 /ORGANISM="Crypthecodinium cohnii, Strain Seligo" /LENGTH=189 /DNA_ID=CAMNT_0053947763 /DNA_START=82 /DNA_END=651 /DNA_ORIENTATION=+
MAHFSDRGHHCSDPYCNQQDLLPTTCDACHKVFCAQHFKYEAHSCPVGRHASDKRVIICPLCQKPLPWKQGEDENALCEAHFMSGECHPQAVGAGQAPKPAVKRCPVAGCKEKLTTLNTVSCGRCRQNVCLKHRYEDSHNCTPPGAAAALSRMASAGGSTCRTTAAAVSQGSIGQQLQSLRGKFRSLIR